MVTRTTGAPLNVAMSSSPDVLLQFGHLFLQAGQIVVDNPPYHVQINRKQSWARTFLIHSLDLFDPDDGYFELAFRVDPYFALPTHPSCQAPRFFLESTLLTVPLHRAGDEASIRFLVRVDPEAILVSNGARQWHGRPGNVMVALQRDGFSVSTERTPSEP